MLSTFGVYDFKARLTIYAKLEEINGGIPWAN